MEIASAASTVPSPPDTAVVGGENRGSEKIPNPVADKLFNYLRDVLYYPNRARLEAASLPEDFRELGEGLIYFAEMLAETRTLARSLSRGDLFCTLPKPENEIASNLKSLHAALKHLTWQAKRVADGDYNQRVGFMGDFADAFNQMVIQLKERQDSLLNEIETVQKHRRDLERSNTLFESITSRMSGWIVVLDQDTGERLFINRPIKNDLGYGILESQLYDVLLNHAKQIKEDEAQKSEEFSLTVDGTVQWFSAAYFPLRWYGYDAVAVVLADITADKAEIDKLEEVAYRDALTGVYSRRYGMNLLNNWTGQGLSFVVCFIDMDQLKYVNDVFGHAEGDYYILRVVDLLRAFSKDACLCRLGGDEFMILATGIDQKTAEDRLEVLRERFVADDLTTEKGGSYRGGLSYGVVEVAKGSVLSAHDILSQADEKMYAYKRAHKAEHRDALV